MTALKDPSRACAVCGKLLLGLISVLGTLVVAPKGTQSGLFPLQSIRSMPGRLSREGVI